MRRPSRGELLDLLRSIDPKDRKDGMQMVCAFLEQGGRLRLDGDLALADALARQRESTDMVMRRWFYKYVGLSGNSAYLPMLRKNLGVEEDPQALAWLLGALVAISSEETAREYAREHDLPDELVTLIPVFAGYFRRDAVSERGLTALVRDDGPLALRWASFLLGRWHEPELAGRVRELNSHPDAEVAEFSIWSVGRSGLGLGGSSVDPDTLPAQTASVRRWSYFLLASDPGARSAYPDLIVAHAHGESDERAREGLAQGLVAGGLRGQWRDFATEWADAETSPRVRRALERGIPLPRPPAVTPRRPSRSAPRPASRPASRSALCPASGTASRPDSRRDQRTMQTTRQQITDVRREMLYVWAIDTVSYSKMDDDAQLSVVRALMGEVSGQEPLSRLGPDRIIYLFTGDGMIVVVRGVERPKDVLVAAHDFLRRCRTVYGFQVRMGINAGPGLVLHLSDGAVQAIGNTVNNAVRVMAAAEADTLTISDAYYTDAFQSGRSAMMGLKFEPRESTDKHGNILRLYDVRD